jgi:hypothetical protein
MTVPESAPAQDRPVAIRGTIADAVARELPGLILAWTDVDVAPGSSPRPLRRRLAHESDRIRGGDAMMLPRRPIPSAYRALFRQIGLDPDSQPTPIERIVTTRIISGGLRSDGRLADASAIALLETSVPVWALDRDLSSGGLRLGLTGAGPASDASSGLVITDEGDLVVPLFADPPQRFAATSRSSRARLFAVGAPGVPPMTVDEALWLAAQLAAR